MGSETDKISAKYCFGGNTATVYFLLYFFENIFPKMRVEKSYRISRKGKYLAVFPAQVVKKSQFLEDIRIFSYNCTNIRISEIYGRIFFRFLPVVSCRFLASIRCVSARQSLLCRFCGVAALVFSSISAVPVDWRHCAFVCVCLCVYASVACVCVRASASLHKFCAEMFENFCAECGWQYRRLSGIKPEVIPGRSSNRIRIQKTF